MLDFFIGLTGIIAGLTAYNTKQHIIRAALEATAFQAHEVSDGIGVNNGKLALGYLARQICY